jgi:transposase
MDEVTTIGLDLAKHVFQVHGVDAAGATVLRKQLRRSQVVAFFAALPGWARGVRDGALLGAGAAGGWPRSSADAGAIR